MIGGWDGTGLDRITTKSSISSSSYKSFCVYDYLDDGTRLIIGKRLNSREQMTIDGYCQWVGRRSCMPRMLLKRHVPGRVEFMDKQKHPSICPGARD